MEEVAAVIRLGRLRWFGHLERMGNEDWVSACQMYEVDSAVGRRGKGRPRKTWEECALHDLHQLGLRRESDRQWTGGEERTYWGKTSNPCRARTK